MKRRIEAIAVLGLAALFLATNSGLASSQQKGELTAEAVEFFEKRIRPILVSSCYRCHGPDAAPPKSGLRLDTREAMLKGGNSGKPAIIIGDPENSRLIKAVRYSDESLQMPPTGKLDEAQIKDLEEWIKMGAPDPRKPLAAAVAYDFDEARKFWSFRPIKDPPLPPSRTGGGSSRRSTCSFSPNSKRKDCGQSGTLKGEP